MFTLAGNLYKYLKKRREKNVTIIILGLDNAGKTTLLFSLKDEISATDTAPTVGFRQSKIVTGKYTIQWFDVGGAKNFRRVWTNYYSEVHGVIYVVDAAAEERLEESKEVLAQTLKAEGIPGKPVLVFANKQDLPGCMSEAELSKRLGMLDWKDCSYNVQACQAKPKPGDEKVDPRVGKGLRWLLDQIDSRYKVLNTRIEKEMEEVKEREKKEKEEMRKRAEASKAARLKEAEEKKKEEEAAAAAAPGGVAPDAASKLDEPTQGQSDGGGAAGKVAMIDVTPAPAEEESQGGSGAVRQGASLGLDTPMTAMSEVAPDKVLPEALTPARPGKLGPLDVESSVNPGPLGSERRASGGLEPRGTPARLGALKPMPKPVATSPERSEVTLPNAIPSPQITDKPTDLEAGGGGES